MKEANKKRIPIIGIYPLSGHRLSGYRPLMSRLMESCLVRRRLVRSRLWLFGLCISLLCISFLEGCGSAQKTTVSMADLCQVMCAADDTLPEMSNVYGSDEDAKELFSSLSDLDYSKVDDYFMSYSTYGLADEIAVIALKNSTDAEKAKETLEDRIQDRLKTFDTYNPDQSKRVDNALIFTKDQYAVLIISDKNDKVKEAFLSYIED